MWRQRIMEKRRMFLYFLAMLQMSLRQSGGMSVSPPSNLGRVHENFTGKTIDEIIMGTLGGVGEASNMILADDRHILAELDMVLSVEQFLDMYKPPEPQKYTTFVSDFTEDYKGSGVRTKRKATSDTKLRWTKAEMPYMFAKGHFTESEVYMIRRAMTEWERYTCLKFKPATSFDKNSIRFQNGVGCNSQLGMVRGVQVINLQAPGCRFKGLYLHEIGHAIGLVHEHQLPNRDNYITILYENVSAQMRVWFNKYSTDQVNQSSVPYEYSSVMHYGITAFARDGKSQTIRARDPSKEKQIGEVYLKELSYTDVQMVNIMYGCSHHCQNQDQCGPDGHLDQNCNCICKDGSSDCAKNRKKIADVTCNNKYDSWACYIWANQGECDRNAYYMNQQCAKACGLCKDTSNNQAECKNVYTEDKCTVWRDRGDCVTNERWMKSNCKMTCNLCGDTSNRPETNCQDIHEEAAKCEEWAKDGECSINPAWMFANCKKSCQMCDKKEVVDPGDGDSGDEDDMKCENKNPSCEEYARAGHCEGSPSYMIPNCRKACNKCDDGTCKNLYDDVQCQIWAEKLECLVNTDWMSKHCAKSCGRKICEGTGSTSGIPESSTTLTSVTTECCRNIHNSDKQCDIWSQNDHCNINPGWMTKNCAKSCKICSGNGGMVITTSTIATNSVTVFDGCQDEEAECTSWAKQGYCDTNPGYNLIFCKKSCNNCNGCLDTNFLCKVWANNGQCEKNAGYMLRHCQKSCKTCNKSSDDLQLLRPHNGAKNCVMTSIVLILCFFYASFVALVANSRQAQSLYAAHETSNFVLKSHIKE